MRLSKGILVLLSLLTVAQFSRGALVSISFRGAVANVDDRNFQLNGSVTNGTPFEGFYIFDDATPNTNPNPDPTVADYWHYSGNAGIVVKVGSYVFRTHPDHVNFLVEIVDRERDNYLLRSYQNVCSTGLLVDHIAWQLDDPTGAAVTGVTLPAGPPNLAAWQSEAGLTIRGVVLGGYNIRGHVTSVQKTPAIIPTPPDVAIAEAVELTFPSLLGYFYQVQYSHDLTAWVDVGEKILGTGDAVKTFVRKVENRPTYYRAQIANTP